MVKVVEEWLNSCAGCEIAILNIGDVLVELLPSIEFVHIPVLIDKKYYGQLGDRHGLEIPEATVGIVSGGVRTSEHLEVLKAVRASCVLVIALGTCATNGGIPALGNMYGLEVIKDFLYRHSPTTHPSPDPDPSNYHIASMYEDVTALDEHVKVDIKLPGCPPHPEWIATAIQALLDGKVEFVMPERSVCDTCPTIRKRKDGHNGILKRMLDTPEYDPETPISQMSCLLEQGFLCMGPVTRAGCGGIDGFASPRCLYARMPCRGCYGPVRDNALPSIDYLGAMASIGYDPTQVLDRRGYLSRFNGAHGVLKKVDLGGYHGCRP